MNLKIMILHWMRHLRHVYLQPLCKKKNQDCELYVHEGSNSPISTETIIDGSDIDIKKWVENCFVEEDLTLNLSDDDEENDLHFDCEDFFEENFELTEDLLQEEFFSTEKQEIEFDNKELYPGSSITIGAFMLLLAIFTSKFNLTGEAIEMLLTLIEVPIINQIQNLFSQEEFHSELQERLHYFKSTGVYRDIYDGSIYRSYFNNSGPLSSPNNISFTMNTDGAPVFKSSKMSLWPIYLMINELPYKLQIKNENMILASLWFDSKKPNMNTLLKPLLHSMELLHNEGVECDSPEIRKFNCKGYLLAGTADLPARCLLFNSIQYNGSYSCWKCLQPGETASVGKGHAHVYPFKIECPKGPPRTNDQTLQDAQTATRNQQEKRNPKVVNGVKRPLWLICFPKFNIVNGIAIDYMHGLLLGVQKLMIRLWFDKSFSKFPFNIHSAVEKVDARLLSLLPTLSITRLPRTNQNHSKYWKASEYRSFLLYYGAPVMYEILNRDRFSHYLNLVNASQILLMNGSTEENLKNAEDMLFSFCEKFSILYDKKYMTLNIHQLVHLVDCVNELGPLYTHSCFPFEDKNGFVLKLIRGTQNIDSQIITGISFIQKLPELEQKCIVKGSDVEKVYNEIKNSQNLKRGSKIENNVYILGAINSKKLDKEQFALVCNLLRYCPTTDTFNCFNRLEFHGNLIYGTDYARMKKRNNSAIIYSIQGVISFGVVKFFISLSETCTAAYNQNIDNKKFDDIVLPSEETDGSDEGDENEDSNESLLRL
ncbi:unnamed protein product [Mytilus coruscus]|uniref:Uncharacterized protein n=1 Tax=Mytilus coruscus TaxID=42192 RepID=A0A6J8BJ99_MYTCO|nr:unnamed protein product [Mytilus coruscus]